MLNATHPATVPLSRKRTERAFSPGPGDSAGPSSFKKARPIGPSQSFGEELELMSVNNSELAGPRASHRTIGAADCAQSLVFQLTDFLPHNFRSNSAALLFGVAAESALRVLVVVTDLQVSFLDFLEHQQIQTMCRVELPGGKYHENEQPERLSHNQIELIIGRQDLIVHPVESLWKMVGSESLRILSFDIETSIPEDKKSFPSPHHHAVLQIGNIVQETGDETRSYRVIYTLRGCSPIVGAEVRSFDTEGDMLLAWRQFVIDCDPDLIIGHTIARFDLMYLIHRAQLLEVPDFACLGRLKGHNTKVAEPDPKLPWRKSPILPGRLQLDVLQYFQEKTRTLAGCKLGELARKYLNGSTKEADVDFTMMNELQNGSDDDRKRLAVYCLKDAHIPMRLLFQEKCIENSVAAARQGGDFLPFSDFLRTGRNFQY
ncbi:DNA polymerase [Favolaschia claudopus]|uniref:DNA polymerase delta catalytic subunit n=1 Tax=Favolaschia claudopus TaxID=2862362 RepID=A0AAW0B930_9AGAR